ncbi:unnamed protein product [Ranitomeya imitator]|uniref:Uncharacterized protein n=1 Tax=Ranitomeya imitator TaxID=111125 RepID=A0ABN9KVZ5_9NEOB|nr:unnamed protein product [Ranitomeya imitator]
MSSTGDAEHRKGEQQQISEWRCGTRAAGSWHATSHLTPSETGTLISSAVERNVTRCTQQVNKKGIANITLDLYKLDPKDFIGCLNIKATFYEMYSVSCDIRCLGVKKVLRNFLRMLSHLAQGTVTLYDLPTYDHDQRYDLAVIVVTVREADSKGPDGHRNLPDVYPGYKGTHRWIASLDRCHTHRSSDDSGRSSDETKFQTICYDVRFSAGSLIAAACHTQRYRNDIAGMSRIVPS